jgi:predicted acetyltransferase
MTLNETAVVLEPITLERASVLDNLFELYVHDFSEQMPLTIKASGRFELTPGDDWWTREGHFPFFIEQGGELAGFALIREGSRVTGAPDVMDVADFFVLRGARGRGLGEAAAHALFSAFPRTWEVRVRRTNVAALRFWSRVVQTWVGKPVASLPLAIEGVDWHVLRFETLPDRGGV